MLLVVGVYSYPALRTKAVLKSERLPVISAPDLALYLNLSTIERPRPGTVVNPWYRVEVPENGAGYLKFRLSPRLFGWLTRLLSGKMWWSLFLWNALWWALAGIAFIWLAHRFLPFRDALLVLAGLFLFMYFNFGMAREEIVAWLHFPALRGFAEIDLPYIRSFSPQVVLPPLLFYLGMQMLALRKESTWRPWVIMTALQLIAFAAFPYATLMMAGTTAIAILGQAFLSRQQVAWRAILLYGSACAIVDLTFLLHGSPIFGRSPGSPSVFHFQSGVLRMQMGKLWIFMGVLTACIAFSRTLAPEIRWTLAGMGATNMLMLLGDAIVPGPPFFLTAHASELEHATFAILLTFAVSVVAVNLKLPPRRARIASGAAACFFLVNGLLLAESGYRYFLPSNREQTDMVNWFERNPAEPGDLVIAQHDACGWVPLLSRAQLLFCRNAQAMLSPGQNHDLQRTREAWYLYFMGKRSGWVDSVSRDPDNLHRLETYGLYGEVSAYVGPELAKQVNVVRGDLIPKLERLERHDPQDYAFLRQFHTIWVIDNKNAPIFQRTKLDEYLDIHSQESSGDLIIYAATPR